MEELQTKQNIFLSYDLKSVEQRVQDGTANKSQTTDVQIERFHNKDLNFSISWYPDLKALYNHTIETHLAELEQFRQAKAKKQSGKSRKQEKKERPRDGLFDADGKRK